VPRNSPKASETKKKHAPSPKRVRRNSLDHIAREAGQVAQQQLRELKDSQPKGTTTTRLEMYKAMMQI
jgi:hypothetical protein